MRAIRSSSTAVSIGKKLGIGPRLSPLLLLNRGGIRLANKQAKQALTPRLACLPILEPPACLLAYLGKPAC
jgi:hypothetical protein